MQLMITVQGYKVVRNTLAMQSHYTPIIIINSIYQPAHTFPELSLITLHIQWVCQSVCVCVCVCVYISSVLSLELRVSIVWDTRLSAQTNKHWALIAKLRILRCGAIGPTCMSVHTHTHTHKWLFLPLTPMECNWQIFAVSHLIFNNWISVASEQTEAYQVYLLSTMHVAGSLLNMLYLAIY